MKLLIAGAGGHGRVVADTAAATGAWSEIAFLDDRYPEVKQSGPWTIIGRISDLTGFVSRYEACLAAFGDAQLRLRVLHEAQAAGFKIPVLIHPAATVSSHAILGAGTVVFAGGVVNVGATLGTGCIVNTAATVDHDCSLADGVHICPGAHLAGDVKIGTCTWFGIGAIARQGVRIGADAIVGAGAVCIKDFGDNGVIVGVPANERRE